MNLSQNTKDNIAYCVMTVLTIYFAIDFMLLLGLFPSSLIAPQRQLELVTLFRPAPFVSLEVSRTIFFGYIISTPMILVLAIILREIIRAYRKK